MLLRSTLPLIACVALAACADDAPTLPQVSRAQLVAALTADAADRLDADGQFVFDAPVPDGSATWVTEAEARRLAFAFWKTFETDAREIAADDRGAPIARTVQLCPRTFFAESGYDPFAPEVVREYRRTFGAAWLVGLCNGTEQQVVIAVSVESTDIAVDANGTVQSVLPGDFYVGGVAPGTSIPTEPEYGAVFVSTRSKRLVARVPRLRRNAGRAGAFSAVWTYELDRPTNVVGVNSGVARSRSTIGVGKWSSATDLRMLDENPDDAALRREETFEFVVNGEGASAVVTRRADVPARWEPVVWRKP